MAKLSMIQREKKRERLNRKYLSKIKNIKDKLKDSKISGEEAADLRLRLQKIPLNALSVRKRNRCALTGRPRGVYRKFTLGRTKLREMAMAGLIPGLTKASW
ncbi:MAG: 30S ribosomal protein S14 [Pseudomonadota bacterium]|nr:30S ribosomal protein S14 [Pseudomonadota bacterium]